METRQIKFNREKLRKYKHVTGPMTKVELEVASNVTEANRINATEPDKSDKYIVNLCAFAPDQVEAIKKLFKDSPEVNIEDTNGLFLTASLFVKRDALGNEIAVQKPMKGEKLLCNIDWVDNAEGTAKLLRVTNVQLQPATTLSTIDLDAFLGLEQEEPESAVNDREVVQTAGK